MNVVDYVLLALLVAMIIVGSKKGLLRELTAFFTLIPAILVSINFMDTISVMVYEKIGGSPMVVTFLSFILLLGVAYAAFKLLGIGLAKIINLQRKGKKDQMGGAFIGFLRGWVVISFIFFLLFLLPMPASFYLVIEDSLFGPTLVKTIPVLYESTSSLHPRNPSFYDKVESALLLKKSEFSISNEIRAEVELVLMQVDKFFNPPVNR
ncbi:MAG: CvpA family protein [candidate division Zixibacteria bacterium]|nr:CvpA family protein [candidate division Zixibacteria bacterium]